jgi:uncharacterized membrane-anchored protein
MTQSRWLLVIAGLMSIFLLYMATSHEWQRRQGTEIVLDMEPVDPRSLFRGHYVRIRTNLHTLNAPDFKGADNFKKGQAIYVSLQKNEAGNWTPVSLSHSRPKTDAVFIVGRVGFINDWAEVKKIGVTYNIESYFADQKTAKDLEKQLSDHDMKLIVALGKTGKAVIKGIQIDDVRQVDSLW